MDGRSATPEESRVGVILSPDGHDGGTEESMPWTRGLRVTYARHGSHWARVTCGGTGVPKGLSLGSGIRLWIRVLSFYSLGLGLPTGSRRNGILHTYIRIEES